MQQKRQGLGKVLISMENEYLQELERFNVEPNFWCAEEYFQRAGWQTKSSEVSMGVVDSDGILMLPTMNLVRGGLSDPPGKCWSSFPFQQYGKFLDYNFIYDPKQFLDLSGGKWQVFRKNSRKFPNRSLDGGFYNDHYTLVSEDDINNLLVSWLEGKEGTIYDDEVMLDYLLEGDHRKFLIVNGALVGINVFDENYQYVNFRYCICKPGQFLSEYMRLLFYTDPEIQSKNKLVNDGGCLDDKNLYAFKMKLNPLKINKIYSWQ